MFEQSKPIFGLVKLTPYHEVHIYTQGKIFVEDDISAYEYSKIRVRKCSALSHLLHVNKRTFSFSTTGANIAHSLVLEKKYYSILSPSC